MLPSAWSGSLLSSPSILCYYREISIAVQQLVSHLERQNSSTVIYDVVRVCIWTRAFIGVRCFKFYKIPHMCCSLFSTPLCRIIWVIRMLIHDLKNRLAHWKCKSLRITILQCVHSSDTMSIVYHTVALIQNGQKVLNVILCFCSPLFDNASFSLWCRIQYLFQLSPVQSLHEIKTTIVYTFN